MSPQSFPNPLPAPLPTDAELAILRILWKRGSATVRQVFEDVTQTRNLGYTTVLKTLQVMLEKGLVERDDSERSHVYRAAVADTVTKRELVTDLVDKAFSGSAQELMQHALGLGKTSRQELDAIQKLLDEARRSRS